MTEEKFIELFNREIDGLNSPRESAELQAYLDSHPDARALFADLATITSALNRVKEVDPPASLKSEVMAALPSERTAPQHRFSIVQWAKDFIELRSSFQYAYVFAAGLILGVAIYSLVGIRSTASGTMDLSDVSGSIIISDATFPFAAGPSFEINLAELGVAATVRTKYSKTLAVVELTLQSRNAIEVDFLYNRINLQFKGYSQSRAVPGNLTIGEAAVRLSNQGENTYILAFERFSGAADVSLRLLDSGRALFEKSLVIDSNSK